MHATARHAPPCGSSAAHSRSGCAACKTTRKKRTAQHEHLRRENLGSPQDRRHRKRPLAGPPGPPPPPPLQHLRPPTPPPPRPRPPPTRTPPPPPPPPSTR